MELLGRIRPWPIRIIRRFERHPLAVVSVASIGFRVGRDAIRFKSGEIDGTEFRARTGSHVGSASGSALGALAGAMAGSVVPGLGNVLGTFAGGVLGEIGGSRLGRIAVEATEKTLRKQSQTRNPDLDGPKRTL